MVLCLLGTNEMNDSVERFFNKKKCDLKFILLLNGTTTLYQSISLFFFLHSHGHCNGTTTLFLKEKVGK